MAAVEGEKKGGKKGERRGKAPTGVAERGERFASHFFCSAAQGFRLLLPGAALRGWAHSLEGGCRRHFSPPDSVCGQRQAVEKGGLMSEKSAAATAAAAASPSPLQRCDRMLTPPDRRSSTLDSAGSDGSAVPAHQDQPTGVLAALIGQKSAGLQRHWFRGTSARPSCWWQVSSSASRGFMRRSTSSSTWASSFVSRLTLLGELIYPGVSYSYR